MATHLSIQPGRLYPQPGFSVEIDSEGKWTATQIFLCHRDSAVALMPRPGTPHPEIPFIAVSGVSAGFAEGDLAEITCRYSGVEPKSPADEKANAVRDIGLSLSEEPLLANPRYADLPTGEREALARIMAGGDKDDQGNVLADLVVSPRGLEALAKIREGRTGYFNPRVTWRVSWVRDSGASAAELNGIGKIDLPEGSPPPLADNRNWLKNGVTQTQEGEKTFRLGIEWLASDPGGWDPDLYSPT